MTASLATAYEAFVAPPPLPARSPVAARRAPDPEAPYDDGLPPPHRPTLAGPVDARFPAVRAPALRLVPPLADARPGPVRTARAELEDPAARAAVLARAVLEALAGDRPVGQLERWTTPDVFGVLAPLVAARTQRPWAATLRRVVVCEPAPGVAEVTAVIQRGPRAGALALRLEGFDGRWLVTALQLG
jgi:hypothetical protein